MAPHTRRTPPSPGRSGNGSRHPRGVEARKKPPAADLLTLDAPHLHRRVLEGLTYEQIARLQAALSLTLDEVSTLLQIPSRTLARRKRSGKLQPDESDRLVRAVFLFDRAVDLFDGDRDAARRWFMTPHPGLGGSLPFEFARTIVGAREVERMIGRLEHGVLA